VFISILTKTSIYALSYYVAILFIVLLCLYFDLAEAQTSNKIEYVFNIEQMKGHLEQAVANKESGNVSLSQAHILHIIMGLYDLI
jgi:hypothetical protein